MPMTLPLEVAGSVGTPAPAIAAVAAVKAWHYVVLVIVYSSKIEYTPAIHRCMVFFRRLMGRVSLAPAYSVKVMAQDARRDDADARGVMLPAVARSATFLSVWIISPLRIMHPSAPASCPAGGYVALFSVVGGHPVIKHAVAIVFRVLPIHPFVPRSAPAYASVENMMPFRYVIWIGFRVKFPAEAINVPGVFNVFIPIGNVYPSAPAFCVAVADVMLGGVA